MMKIRSKIKRKYPRLLKFLTHIYNERNYRIHKKMKTNNYKSRIVKMYNKRHTNDKIDLDNPRTYNEKMQVRKLQADNDLMRKLSDKYEVRKWVSSRFGSQYLPKLYGVYDTYNQIDFSKLPNKYVIKGTHGSRMNIISDGTNHLNKNKVKKSINKWLSTNYAYYALELQYLKIQPRIIIEEFLGKTDELYDYKFLCFGGKAYYCWVDIDRHTDHRRNMYDMNWQLQNFNQNEYKNTDQVIDIPQNFKEMVKVAEGLAEQFDHVRVDLYSIKDKIYFGEMTFTSGRGFNLIQPKSADLMLGNLWQLTTK